MSKVKIETLSAVHIGSGNMLQNNTDFVVDIDGEDSYIYLTDENKILELIGVEHIDNWLISIENRSSTKELIKRFAPNSKPKDYSNRIITCFANNIKASDTLKETIHNGQGLPYIPGSSIKGAIRTAILATLADNVSNKEEKIIQKRMNNGVLVPKTDRFGNTLLFADNVEKELFGKNPNSDIFRFIRVGDAYFEKNSTIATRMVNLNITQNKELFDTSKPQLIEAIGTEETSFFQLHIAKDYYEWTKNKFSALGKMPNDFHDISSLFNLINIHTQHLLEEEIEYWKEIDKTGAEIYIETMEELLKESVSCKKGKSCILRIGHGSGWRFITGAWAESLDNFTPDVTNAARPKNFQYTEYDFPKTRRIDEDDYLLGFVKLTFE